MREVDGRIVWAPRVPRAEIRRLYESEAAGLLDEQLCDRVAWAIWERCCDIITVTRAHTGEATCPRCEASGAAERTEEGRGPDVRVRLDDVWERTSAATAASSSSVAERCRGCEEFAAASARGRETPREQMLLIDRLINRWHWDLKHPEPNEKRPRRPSPSDGDQRDRRNGRPRSLRSSTSSPGSRPTIPSLQANREAFETNRKASFRDLAAPLSDVFFVC